MWAPTKVQIRHMVINPNISKALDWLLWTYLGTIHWYGLFPAWWLYTKVASRSEISPESHQAAWEKPLCKAVNESQNQGLHSPTLEPQDFCYCVICDSVVTHFLKLAHWSLFARLKSTRLVIDTFSYLLAVSLGHLHLDFVCGNHW